MKKILTLLCACDAQRSADSLHENTYSEIRVHIFAVSLKKENKGLGRKCEVRKREKKKAISARILVR